MNISTITPQELAELCKKGETVDIFDVRTPVEFQEVHVAKAHNVPLDQLDAPAIVQSRQDDAQPVYVICRSGSRGQQAAEKLLAAGCTKVFNVEGGTQACIAAGLPVVRGTAKVISLERQVRIAAGLLTVLGVLMGWLVHPAFYGLSAFVGVGLTFAGVTDWCGMGMLLAKMPWNRAGSTNHTREKACSA